MASARRRARHKYHGERIQGSKYYGGPKDEKPKMERTKQSKGPSYRRPFRLPLVVKPNGRWGYRFRKLRQLK